MGGEGRRSIERRVYGQREKGEEQVERREGRRENKRRWYGQREKRK